MGLDLSRVWNHTGKLQIATIVIGAVDVGLTFSSYLKHLDKEIYFLIVVVTAVTISSLMVLGSIFGLSKSKFTELTVTKSLDVAYHGLMAVLLGIGSVFMAIHVDKYKEIKLISAEDGKSKNIERIWATGFGFLNALLYACTSLELYGRVRRRSQLQITL